MPIPLAREMTDDVSTCEAWLEFPHQLDSRLVFFTFGLLLMLLGSVEVGSGGGEVITGRPE